MDMKPVYNLSTSPHVRGKDTTSKIMFDVILSLIPATVVGVAHFWRYGGTALGVNALLIVVISVLTAMGTEYSFNRLTHRKNTLWDFSAVVTGLLLALCLPPTVPLYISFLGALFAIMFAKCLFGGLGQNFMNPALAGRAFVSISFTSVVTSFAIDGVSSATPLDILRNGGSVSLMNVFMGFDNGVIGLSAIALIIGGVYLLARKIITWEIPVSFIVGFAVIVAFFGEGGFDPEYLAIQICGGGVLMGALFMATDMVTSPIAPIGHLIYGGGIGILAGIFRVFGSAADSVSFAIIIGNLFVPLIDMYVVPKPYCARRNEKREVPKEAIILCCITLVAGVALAGVNAMTKDTIAANLAKAEEQSYRDVCPGAVEITSDNELNAKVEAEGTSIEGVIINKVRTAVDESGNVVGYALSVTSTKAFDGKLTASIGIAKDGTVTGLAFTELNETAGMGMRVDETEFKEQFVGAKVDAFLLNKAGGSTAENEIDSISGASISSGAVVDTVNAAIAFLSDYIG